MFGCVLRWFGAAFCAFFLVGCGSNSLHRAPVEERGGAYSTKTTAPNTVAKQPLGFENAGKLGYYTVKPGDTLIQIGLEHGQSYKDVARWNALENPNKIEVGQVLRVVTPTSDTAVLTKPVTTPGASAVVTTPAVPASAPAKAASASNGTASNNAASSNSAEDDLGWIWPSKGSVLANFDEAKNKGLDIGGSLGDAVLATTEGKVVYADSGLRGYGNLIILKHNNTFLSAYAHNQTLLVKEDQMVKKGQKIAEMGNSGLSESSKPKLHFEIRKQGKPVDPMRYLPSK
jgi:lipoprotein NlpD